jgi:hypothetical protein
MPPNHTQRPQFYEGQYLSAEDLQALMEYEGTVHARHALGAHTWGIASGLQLIERDVPGGIEVYLTPGYSWDGLGRPVAVLAPYKISSALFRSIIYDATLDEPKGRLIKVWLRYDEIKTQPPAPGFETCDGKAFARVQESFRIEIGEPSINDRQSLLSAGPITALAREIPSKLGMPPTILYDESIPFQQFPEDGAAARWLIPVGSVRWKPNSNPSLPGTFLKREPDDLTSSRRQRWSIGVVAETIRPVEDVVRIRGRGQDPAPKRWSTDLAWVEGDLRIDGKLSLCDAIGGNLKWQIDGTTANITVGAANATGSSDARLCIQSTGRVGIGTVTPGAQLDVNGNINYARLNKLDVEDNFSANVRAADFCLGHSTRRGSIPPGRALVDYIDNTLVINFASDWSNVRIEGTLSLASSRMLKKNVENFNYHEAKEILHALAPIKFCFIADITNKTQIGFIAEDVPDVLATADRKGISPMSMIGVLVQVVKEHQKSIGLLEKTVESIESKLKSVRGRRTPKSSRV